MKLFPIILAWFLLGLLVCATAHAETDEQRAQRYRRENAYGCQNLAFAHLHVEYDRALGVCRVKP
jgi:hypothetical protein